MWTLFCWPFLVTLAALVGEIAAISIVQAPQDQSILVGGTVIFRCTVRNKGSFKVYWRFDRTETYLSADTVFFEDARDPQFSLVGNHALGQFNLRITNVQPRNAGVYRCGFVPVGSTTLTSRSARLTVLLPPDEGFPRCEVTPPAGMISLGQRATLTCTSQGGVPPASLTWLQNGMEISPVVMQRNVIQKTFDSDLNGVRLTCRATSPAFMEVRTCSIIPLNIPPTVRVDPPQLITRPGENAMYRYTAGGVSPIVEVTWKFGVIIVSSLDRDDRFLLSENFRTLTILDVRLADDLTSVQCTVATITGLSATAGALLRVLPPTTEAVTLTATTLTPDPNMTEPLPTQAFATGLGTVAIILIIIGGIVVSQIIVAIVVYVSHKVSASTRRGGGRPMRGESIVPSLAGWQLAAGTQAAGTQAAGAPSAPPYQDLGEPDRSASANRYLSLHPLRMPPYRYSTPDVGIYEAASEPIVVESGYVMQGGTEYYEYRDSMNTVYNAYQPALRASALNPVVYEQPRQSVNAQTATDDDDYDYDQPPKEDHDTNQPSIYYEPPLDTKLSSLSDTETEDYELPPVQPDLNRTEGPPPRVTSCADVDDDEYCEPPTETSHQSTDRDKLDDAHVYDVAPEDDDEYEVPNPK